MPAPRRKKEKPKLNNRQTELLAITGNPSFDPDDREDIVRALETGARYAAYEHGEANYDYAIDNMNIQKTGREYAQVYKDAINGR